MGITNLDSYRAIKKAEKEVQQLQEFFTEIIRSADEMTSNGTSPEEIEKHLLQKSDNFQKYTEMHIK